MRTLADILADMRQRYEGNSGPTALLLEMCRILASEADPERAGGNGRVSALVEEIVEEYERRVRHETVMDEIMKQARR